MPIETNQMLVASRQEKDKKDKDKDKDKEDKDNKAGMDDGVLTAMIPMSPFEVMGLFHVQLGKKLNVVFEEIMTEIFANVVKNDKTRIEKDIHYAPVKTLSRALVKREKYLVTPSISCVTDFVRIAVVCKDENEMVRLYQAIEERFLKDKVGYTRFVPNANVNENENESKKEEIPVLEIPRITRVKNGFIPADSDIRFIKKHLEAKEKQEQKQKGQDESKDNNMFDDISSDENDSTIDKFYYRNILINVIIDYAGFKDYFDKYKINKNCSMIVEIQLLLDYYYKIRESMHLYYKICRTSQHYQFKESEWLASAVAMAQDFSKYMQIPAR